MAKIGLIGSLLSNHQSNYFPKQLYKHLNIVTFLQEYFSWILQSRQNQSYFEGGIFGANKSWGGKETEESLQEDNDTEAALRGRGHTAGSLWYHPEEEETSLYEI